MSFVDGELYERSFDTPAGPIDVLAEIVVTGSTVELRDLVVYPRDAVRLTVSPGELLGWARLAVAEIAEVGFAELRVTGTRPEVVGGVGVSARQASPRMFGRG